MGEAMRPDELRTHVAIFLLLSSSPIRIQDIEANVSRSGISKSDLIWLLESDSENRFLIHRIDDDPSLVSRNTTTSSANDALLMGQIEKWRSNLSILLADKIEPVELSLIGSILLQVPMMVKSLKLKLKDLILFDPLQRFQIIGEPPIFYVKRVLSNDEIVTYIMDWMESIFNYLLKKGWYANLNEIASQFRRPFPLPKSIRLLEMMRNDTLNRFHFDGEGCDLRVKAIVDPVQADQYTIIWRDSVAHHLFKQGIKVSLSQIGVDVPRPNRLPGEYKLQDILKSDPSERFVMNGGVNHVMVRLSKKSYKEMIDFDCSDEAYKEDYDTISEGEWTKIVSKSSKFIPLIPKSRPTKSFSHTKSNTFETVNFPKSKDFGIGIKKNLCSVEIKTPIGPVGNNLTFRKDPSELLQGEFTENGSREYLGTLFNASNQTIGQDNLLPIVSSIQDNFNSFPATANDSWLNTQSLSMSLTSPPPSVSPSLLISESTVENSNASSSITQWLDLDHWLPKAFDGFDSVLVKGFLYTLCSYMTSTLPDTS